MKKIPTTVITGFLGSGKTTIIKNLVEHLTNKGQKVAYVKNEIGAEDFDTQLVQGKNIQTIELLNGCICCTLVGPFMAAIDELANTYAFDRIIIETAGSADPASMALSVSNHPRLLRDGVITIVDVVNFDGYEDLSFVAKRQAELTDLIVFNKIELADTQRKQAVVGYVRELNERAPIVEAIGGVLNPNVAFGIASAEVEEILKEHDVDSHELDDGITAFTFVSDAVFDKEALRECVQNQLPKTVIRVKGLAQFRTGWEIVNTVYKRYDSQPAPQELLKKNSTKLQTRLIVIGYKINDDAQRVSDLFRRSVLLDAADPSTQQ
jgi:G3E family GTPase